MWASRGYKYDRAQRKKERERDRERDKEDTWKEINDDERMRLFCLPSNYKRHLCTCNNIYKRRPLDAKIKSIKTRKI